MFDLKGRSIIVTGGASGIGRAACVMFAGYGASVTVADLDEEQGRRVSSQIVDNGGRASFYKCNVADEGDVSALVDESVRQFGRLDGAFNNAGIEGGMNVLHEITFEQWQRLVNVDLTGVFLCLKYQIRAMLKTGGGSIVNTASSLGQKAIPFAADYVAAKHGVIGMTRAAAVDYGEQGVRINAVLPGMTDTPMVKRAPNKPELAPVFGHIQASVPMKRLGQAEEIAQAAAWLLSDAASFVTGVMLPVDGGYLAT